MLTQLVKNGGTVLPPPRKHIWSNDPAISAARRTLLCGWVVLSVSVWIVCLLMYLIFLGSTRFPTHYTKNLHVLIIDFDQQQAGSLFLQSFQESTGQILHWIYRSPAYYQNDPNNVINEVQHGKVWAVVYIKAGTTQLINSTINSIFTSSYKSTVILNSSIIIAYDEGRNSNSVPTYVVTPITNIIAAANAKYTNILLNQLNQQLLSSSNNSVVVSINSVLITSVLNNPLKYTAMNLHPAIYHFSGTIGTTLGYLVLWVVVVGHVAATLSLTSLLIGKFKVIEILLFRLFYGIFQGFFISLIFSLCVLWFATTPLHGTFVRYWLFNWLVAITFIIINAAVSINLGHFATLFLTLFLTLNLSSSGINFPIELQPKFYRIGYGLPLYQCMSGGRHFVFGSYTHLSLNIGILIAYYSGFFVFILCTGLYRAKKQEKEVIEKQRNGGDQK
ncbi:unnamed protein product [Didymodactylos carnosus]|uniref:DUF3533 domain-containing protein n=1 Tax=Didymodactylos carnosus TaxID=1234261 RepID=A0A815SEE7_9BILA|nr:unnamed protein product [Didymodactylos carnosus]CAF4354719.1 unnamed protein product [Didymodactylos carnosus]